MRQGHRHGLGGAREVDGGPLDPAHLPLVEMLFDAVEEVAALFVARPDLELLLHRDPSLVPDSHEVINHDPDGQRHPAVGQDLMGISEDEQQFEDDERREQGVGRHGRYLEPVPHILPEEDGRHDHREADGDAVGAGEVFGVLVVQDEIHGADHQHPVDDRDVDLAGFHIGGPLDAHPGEVGQLDGLHRDGEGAGDEGLGGDDGRERRDDHQRDLRPVRCHVEEGIETGRQQFVGMRERPGTLSEVI